MKRFIPFAAVALLFLLLGMVAGDYYFSPHARDLSGFVGSLIGALAAGLIAVFVVRYEAHERRLVGKAIIRSQLDIVNRSIANYQALRNGEGQVFPNPNNCAGEIDAVIKTLAGLERVCADLQSSITGAAEVRTIVIELGPRLALLAEIVHPFVTPPLPGQKMPTDAEREEAIFAPEFAQSIAEVKRCLGIAEQYLTSGLAERFLKL